MAFNGSGVYSLASGNPVVTGTTISSTWANDTLTDIANNGLTKCLTKDGQSTPTANIPLGGFKITGLAAGTATTDATNLTQVQAGAYAILGAVAGTDTITASATPTLAAYANGNTFRLVAAGTNTGATTLNINSLGAKAITKNGTTALGAGDIPSGAMITVVYDGTQFQLNNVSTANIAPFVDTTALVRGSSDATKLVRIEADGLTTATTRVGTFPDKDITFAGLVDLRSYISGLTLSTAGSSATMTIAAGQAIDSTNVRGISLASSLGKTTSAWAVGTGNGGLDTGSIANATWYYFYLIIRPDTNVVDVVFSTSPSSPTLPTNYTLYRYIGAGLTNGSAQWIAFTQQDDDFYWSTPILDFSGAGSATATLLTCSVPRGRKVKAAFNVAIAEAGSVTNASYFSDPSNADVAPSTTVAPLGSVVLATSGGTALSIGSEVVCWTNTSAQVRHREITTATMYVTTLGWTDTRGRNA